VLNDITKVAGTKPVALRWTSLDPTDRTLEAFVGLGKAQNWEEFKAALALFSAPSQNFVYADIAGNIGYMAPARFPVRKPGHNGQKPMPGDGNWDWLGYLPQSLWPQVYNPKEGFIVTANNKAVPANYPYLISLEWEEPYRAERVRQLILSRPKHSPQDMMAMQADITSLLWREFRPLLQVLSPVSERSREWREKLLAWDGVMGADKTEPAVFQSWYSELSRLPAKEVGKDFWEEPRYLLRAMQQGDPGCKQDGMQNCLEYAALALDKAIDRFGDAVPVWGQVHQAAFNHRILGEVPLLKNLANRSVPMGGDRYTLNRASYDPATFTLSSHSSYRHIIDFSDLENSRFIYPMGQSGAPFSRLYANLLPLWQKGQYLPMKMQGYKVAERQTLEPGR
jgi:penicillin amidase